VKLSTLKPRIQTISSTLSEVQSDSWRADKRTSAQRGYSYKWQQARAAYLLKHPLCVMCTANAGIEATEYMAIAEECMRRGIPLPTAATVVDHSVAHRGDMKVFWDSSLWQSLCSHHHSADAQRRDNENDSRWNIA